MSIIQSHHSSKSSLHRILFAVQTESIIHRNPAVIKFRLSIIHRRVGSPAQVAAQQTASRIWAGLCRQPKSSPHRSLEGPRPTRGAPKRAPNKGLVKSRENRSRKSRHPQCQRILPLRQYFHPSMSISYARPIFRITSRKPSKRALQDSGCEMMLRYEQTSAFSNIQHLHRAVQETKCLVLEIKFAIDSC